MKNAGGTFHHWGILPHRDISNDFMNDPKYFLPKVYRTEPFQTFEETFAELGHTNRNWIDVLKIDCEGCEWDSLQYWLQDWEQNLGKGVRQILIELHNSPYPSSIEFFTLLKQNHYVITHKENTGSSAEYNFLKLHPNFFL